MKYQQQNCHLLSNLSVIEIHSISVVGLLSGIIHCYSNFNRTFCKLTVDYLIAHCGVWSGSACLSMSHKKDAMLIWV